jgi:hypothetical protein
VGASYQARHQIEKSGGNAEDHPPYEDRLDGAEGTINRGESCELVVLLARQDIATDFTLVSPSDYMGT